ncbi:MAG: hypothetical protein CM1200mP39_05670 [Dehalococcoidia bacterium]|nr:MAG: hypothetical protein CM1200mP39_05670 [Dehalococcoidia bacterium]
MLSIASDKLKVAANVIRVMIFASIPASATAISPVN